MNGRIKRSLLRNTLQTSVLQGFTTVPTIKHAVLENGQKINNHLNRISFSFKNQEKNHSTKLPTTLRKQTCVFTFQVTLSVMLHFYYTQLDF